MAAPNIVNVVTITGKTAGLAVTTGLTAIVTNSSGSGKVFKINTLMISNIDGTNSADITVDVYKNQTTAFDLASTVSVPADASLIIISKENTIYLEENDSIRLLASANGDLEAVCSYEEIS
jgi:hypothetical protein